MGTETKTCPFCSSSATFKYEPDHNTVRVTECDCKGYLISEGVLDDVASKCKGKQTRVTAALRERRFKGGGVVTPRLRLDPKVQIRTDAPVLDIVDLISNWPQSFSTRVERAFCNLVGMSQHCPGRQFQLDLSMHYSDLFTDDFDTAQFILKVLHEWDWLESVPVEGDWRLNLKIRPKGWAKYDEITHSTSLDNDVFVAMWFGGKERSKVTEMLTLFNDVMKPAMNEAGYKAKRADTDEHNDPIMDQVIASIRKAPFIVAECTDNNPGVYYEAGFARGLGKQVVYCVRKGQRVHFDITAVNHVRWANSDELRTRLHNRIIGSIGPGPHEQVGSEASGGL
jgi:hypothetical protein